MRDAVKTGALRIGWAGADITPGDAVLIAGQFHARLSEGVADPITATVLVLDGGDDHAVFVSCDLVAIPDELREAVRRRVASAPGGPNPLKVILHATHTHTGPEVRPERAGAGHTSMGTGVELPAMSAEAYLDFASGRIADAVRGAWGIRMPGAVAFGQGHAVVGRNRRWVDLEGRSTMYGKTDTPGFSHIEGYEDHSVNVLATFAGGALTGLVVNVPCPAQVSEHEYVLGADYWCETREELRRRLGAGLPVLAQCSAAGDQSPHLLFEKRAAERMRTLSGRTEKTEIAQRIAAAVEDVLAQVGGTAEERVVLGHRVEALDLPLNRLSAADVETATAEAAALRQQYERETARLAADPRLKEGKRWYREATYAYRRMRWCEGVALRFREQEKNPTRPLEIHVIRLGDLVVATNPFEYYLDFGVRIKARSKAVQTFLVQLAGGGTYVPTLRSTQGGGYGSIPASNPVGPEGGRILVEKTVELIARLWAESP